MTEPTPRADPDAAETQPEIAPELAEIGSDGAQRIVGARTSGRVSAGEPADTGPPLDNDQRRRSARLLV